MTALACGVAAAAFWLARLRSPHLPVPIISNPDHQNTIAHICDVYRDYLSFSTATQVLKLYEILGLDAAWNPGVADVWLALRDRVEGNYYVNGGPLDDISTSAGLLHGERDENQNQDQTKEKKKRDAKGWLGSHDDGEASWASSWSPQLPPLPPMPPQASEVWAQIANVLIDSKLRTTYDQVFMSVLTGLGVDRTAVLSRMCRWNEE
ncbi:hypothetical protein ColKHC_14303 [Colletotrichum higginsianum]|nr:hypothetical protein ColKHC_14303 [Colletotrichum higginsianum]